MLAPREPHTGQSQATPGLCEFYAGGQCWPVLPGPVWAPETSSTLLTLPTAPRLADGKQRLNPLPKSVLDPAVPAGGCLGHSSGAPGGGAASQRGSLLSRQVLLTSVWLGLHCAGSQDRPRFGKVHRDGAAVGESIESAGAGTLRQPALAMSRSATSSLAAAPQCLAQPFRPLVTTRLLSDLRGSFVLC